ncbi:MAG: hypothetical protein ACTSVV_10735 [Promethearchaeota archaeon]
MDEEKLPEIKVSEDGKLIINNNTQKALKLITELLSVCAFIKEISEKESNHYKKIYKELLEIINDE